MDNLSGTLSILVQQKGSVKENIGRRGAPGRDGAGFRTWPGTKFFVEQTGT